MTCLTHLNDLQLQVVPHISQKLCAKTTQYATFFATNSFVCRCANALEGYPAWQMTVVMTRVLQKCQDAHSYKLHFSFFFLCVLHLAIRQCSRDRRTCSCARIRGVTLELCCTRLARGFLLGGVFGLEWHVHSCVAFVSFFFFFPPFFFCFLLRQQWIGHTGKKLCHWSADIARQKDRTKQLVWTGVTLVRLAAVSLRTGLWRLGWCSRFGVTVARAWFAFLSLFGTTHGFFVQQSLQNSPCNPSTRKTAKGVYNKKRHFRHSKSHIGPHSQNGC